MKAARRKRKGKSKPNTTSPPDLFGFSTEQEHADALLAQALAEEELALEQQREEEENQVTRLLQEEQDQDLARELQSLGDVHFAKQVFKEFGPLSYAVRAAGAKAMETSNAFVDSSCSSSSSSYTVESLIVACQQFSNCNSKSSSSSAQATRDQLSYLYAKDPRYSLAYQDEIQRVKSRLQQDLHREADQVFLTLNPQVINFVLHGHLLEQVDLHKLTVVEAQVRVFALFALCKRQKHISRLSVITGKGTKLFPAVQKWCRDHEGLVRNFEPGQGLVVVHF